MSEDYKNREIDEKFGALHQKLDLILEQTQKTNGRVTKLEDKTEDLSMWKNIQVGAISIISMIVLPLVVYIFNLK
jgi:hypothetical protein